MTSQRQIADVQAWAAELQARMAAAEKLIAAIAREAEKCAGRMGWLADWNRLTAQQQFALSQIAKGFRRGVNVRTAQSLLRLGLIEPGRDEYTFGKWLPTEAGARLADAAGKWLVERRRNAD